jgi:hypothetical protein
VLTGAEIGIPEQFILYVGDLMFITVRVQLLSTGTDSSAR